ncbi:riboflavin synthase [Qipengyuania marisflavi]|uniref:Riboflavin synthase n=1 Tax=Qipengyuania marisflavi TaxID=2486356 RepID=A0A5S3P3X6_9SPHN|nr:riboflavin synthase [Qipengyuania marisflavi]TMM45340.1 riboflavin synthase [Qipengyuania marisflavi]
MFTGIVTAIGTITSIEERGDRRVTVACEFDPATIDIGASIACSGVCLTVVELAGSAGDARIGFDVSAETVSRTAPAMWEQAAKLNLEAALRLGDELGGHLVTGHVDAVGHVAQRREEGGSTRLRLRAGPEIAPYVAEKGSITVNGVSLTVNTVTDETDGTVLFDLNIIPHTAEVTTLGALAEGDAVNLEIDVLARYLQRMQSLRG